MTEQREAIETTTVGELKQLNANLRAVVQSEQSITESVMVSHHAALRRGLVGISKMVLLCYLALFVALIVGLVGIGLVWDWRIESGREEFDKIMADIAAQQPTLRQIEQKTWGVRYREAEDGRRWLLLPPGSRAYQSPDAGVDWVVRLPKK